MNKVLVIEKNFSKIKGAREYVQSYLREYRKGGVDMSLEIFLNKFIDHMEQATFEKDEIGKKYESIKNRFDILDL